MSAVPMDYGAETVSIRDDRQRISLVSLPKVETYSYVASPTIGSMLANLLPSLPLFTIAIDGNVVPLSRPIMLRVAFDDGQYFVENDTLMIFGNGETLAKAVLAFQHEVAYYVKYYRNLRNEDVAGTGARLKRIYEDLTAG